MNLLNRFACLLALTAVLPVQASRTGLNNVPTADTSAARTGVVQAYSAFGPDRKTTFLTGVRGGFLIGHEKVEAGFDTRWQPQNEVPLFFNAKWGSHWAAKFPALGIGVANLAPSADDRRIQGQPQSYAVLSYDLHLFRAHAGYASQTHNNAVFFGVDRSWVVADRKLTFRSDIIEIQDGAQWLASAGFTYKITTNLGIELWQSKPTERGTSYTTCKLGWGFSY